MKREVEPKSFGTHDGRFHADEVTACALLLLFDLIDRKHIYRTRDPAILQRMAFVCDVGGIYQPKEQLFDHHQADYEGSYSSAGMILAFLRDHTIISHDLYHHLYQELVFGVDAYDNGIELLEPNVCTFSHIISNFCPIEYGASKEDEEETFFHALDFTLGHLQRLINRFDYTRSCRSAVKEAMNKSTLVLMFEEGLPWIDSFFELGGENHPAKFVIMPAGEHWKLRGIPPSLAERMQVRLPLPQSWAGLLDKELEQISGIPGAIFCHKGRFISVWETKKAALQALDFILRSTHDHLSKDH